MSLNPTNLDIIRDQKGFVFFMEIENTKELVRVLVTDEVLSGFEEEIGEYVLRVQFDGDRPTLEEIAREKYSNGQVRADGLISITFEDIARLIE